MAQATILRETGLSVIRIRGDVEVLLVAADAICARSLEIPAHVASRAIQADVGARKEETCEFAVIEAGPRPAVHVVAGLASGRKADDDMVGQGGLDEVLLVARNAVRGEAGKLAAGRSLVAVLAHQGCMRADQREAIFVPAYRAHRHLPARDRMAALALCAELTPMNVGMAVRALHTHVAENEGHVALGAGDSFVHAAQGEAGLVVVELQGAPQRFPAGKGMTVLTGDFQIAMWAARV